MTIQGMSQGLAFSSMSYYMQETGLPVTSDCGDTMITGTGSVGLYDTQFNMGTSVGAAIIVFEVGDVKEAAYGGSAIATAVGDKLTWEYLDKRGSEYSSVHMGDTDNSGSNPDVMHGMGYMRGLIGAAVTGSSPFINPHTPLSTVEGSQLTAGTTPDHDDTFGPSGVYAITTGDKEYEYLNATQASAASKTHGLFKDLNLYSWDGTQFVIVGSGKESGPYTGHSESETVDYFGHTYIGASAVTLHANSDSYASRQAMMVVPVTAGGFINVRIEAPIYEDNGGVPGTWHRHMCFCPIELPKWGNADDKTGVQSGGSPYATAASAGRHNFSDPSSPYGDPGVAGGVAGENTTYFHVASQSSIYRQQGYSPFTVRNGGHVIGSLNHDSAGGTKWAGVVNRFDWVFSDNGGYAKLAVGFYAIQIDSSTYVIEVGDTNTAGVAQAGVVKDTTFEWIPTEETSACMGWWPKSGTFTLNGSAVSGWEDESQNNNHLVQATAGHQPSGVSSGVVTFDGGTTNQHMDTTSQITLANDLTIGMVINAAEVNNRILMGDNTTANNWFRIADEDTLHVKFDSASVKGLGLNPGTTFNDALYLVITKNSSNILHLYINGVLQTNTISSDIAGQMLIDAVGIRYNLANEFGGTMSEIMIFNSESAVLTQNVNDYLSSI